MKIQPIKNTNSFQANLSSKTLKTIYSELGYSPETERVLKGLMKDLDKAKGNKMTVIDVSKESFESKIEKTRIEYEEFEYPVNVYSRIVTCKNPLLENTEFSIQMDSHEKISIIDLIKDVINGIENYEVELYNKFIINYGNNNPLSFIGNKIQELIPMLKITGSNKESLKDFIKHGTEYDNMVLSEKMNNILYEENKINQLRKDLEKEDSKIKSQTESLLKDLEKSE